MNPNQHFFQAFFGPQQTQIQQQIPEYITHNEIVLEIINNWDCVKELISKIKSGKTNKVDQIEQTWITFITQKNINIDVYKNEEDFFNAFWKIPN